MTRAEALRKLADIIFNAAKSGYMPYDTNDELCAMSIAKKHIDDFYTSLPSNLDEAAEEIASDIAPMHPDIGWDECFEKIKDGIKAGAEWMAGLGVTIDGKVIMDFSEPADIINRRLIAKLGDSLLEIEPGEVVVQIRKK